MNATTQSFFMPFLSLGLFSGVLYGAFFAIRFLTNFRGTDPPKIVYSQAMTGFAPPLAILFAWELVFNELVSFNLISLIWLLLLALSIALLAVKASRFIVAKAYAAGLLLGCCTSFVCAICLTMLD